MDTNTHHTHATLCPNCGEPLVAVNYFWSRRGFENTFAASDDGSRDATPNQPCSCPRCGLLGAASGAVAPILLDQPAEHPLW